MVPDKNGEKRSLLTKYGRVSLANVLASKKVVTTKDAQDTQDSYLIFCCFFNSLLHSAKTQINLCLDNFNIHVKQGSNKWDIPSRPLILKVIITESRMNSTATTIALCVKIRNLPVTIATFCHSIPRFNTHIKQIIADLAARGKSAPNLSDHLIWAYLGTPDTTFVNYIKRCQDYYEEGNTLHPDALMSGAKNKYNVLIATSAWQQCTPAE